MKIGIGETFEKLTAFYIVGCGVMDEIYDSEYDKLVENIEKIAYGMKDLSNIAVCQYAPIVDDIIAGRITEEDEIAHVMDWMLDFCQFNNMLQLFKRLCRGIYYKFPRLVTDYIFIYKEMWDSDNEE